MAKGFLWTGEEIKRKMEKAARLGINKTMSICVAQAKSTHPFTNRTGQAERSIRISSPAVTAGGITFGTWGSVQNSYFKYLEFGTKFIREGKFETLRPTAKLVYPLLSRFIKEEYRGLK